MGYTVISPDHKGLNGLFCLRLLLLSAAMAPRPHRAFGGDREDKEARRLHRMKRPRAGGKSGVDRRFFFEK